MVNAGRVYSGKVNCIEVESKVGKIVLQIDAFGSACSGAFKGLTVGETPCDSPSRCRSHGYDCEEERG